jgi:hypothetical protein
MSAANRLAFLGLPSELLTAMAEVILHLLLCFSWTLTIPQMGIDINSLLEMPEHIYIMQFMEIMQQLPDAVQKPIRVKDASAFNSFLDDSKQSFFKKFLVLSSLNDATWMEPDQRFDGQHYVSLQLATRDMLSSFSRFCRFLLSLVCSRGLTFQRLLSTFVAALCKYVLPLLTITPFIRIEFIRSSGTVHQRRTRNTRTLQSCGSSCIYSFLHRKSYG